ncbi:hypothetical protein As57867_019053, partial [Aphanomyces stellatus]
GWEFKGLRPDQVSFGVPSGPKSANRGFVTPETVLRTLTCLVQGTGCDTIKPKQTYPTFRGVMTWSINWDKYDNFAFSKPARQALDSLGGNSPSPPTPSSQKPVPSTSAPNTRTPSTTKPSVPPTSVAPHSPSPPTTSPYTKPPQSSSPKPTAGPTNAPVTPTPSSGSKCDGKTGGVCYWPFNKQVLPYAKSDCDKWTTDFVWCP